MILKDCVDCREVRNESIHMSFNNVDNMMVVWLWNTMSGCISMTESTTAS